MSTCRRETKPASRCCWRADRGCFPCSRRTGPKPRRDRLHALKRRIEPGACLKSVRGSRMSYVPSALIAALALSPAYRRRQLLCTHDTCTVEASLAAETMVQDG